tara:strand:- start:66 stop:389 length:324 start_codon:yes stop_codon:yes gene_type:complete
METAMKLGTLIKIDYYDIDQGLQMQDFGCIIREGYLYVGTLPWGDPHEKWMIEYLSLIDNLEFVWSHQDPYEDYDGAYIYEVFHYMNDDGEWVSITTKKEWDKLFDK